MSSNNCLSFKYPQSTLIDTNPTVIDTDPLNDIILYFESYRVYLARS